MSRLVPPEVVEPVVRGLLGAVDVDGGPTAEQLAVLRAITTHLWARPDLVVVRNFVVDGRTSAAADFDRFLAASVASRHEPGLSAVPPDAPEPELAARVRAFTELPAGSLGRAYLAFYERHHLSLPGEEATSFNHFFVAHDMTHVIAGIEPTAAGEIAVSAFQLGMDDNTINTGALLASLVVHEAGFGSSPTFGSEAFVLADPVAADLLGRSLARGAACTGDFSLADPVALAPLPLAEVRAQFGVPAPGNPDDGHHCW
ncbi:MAG: hypothetical protein U0W40_15190 [Acidimicrobiia bacterium]